MIIERTASEISVRFEPKDWKCGRAGNFIEDIKRDIPRAAWKFDADTKLWTIRRSLSVEATFDEICARHLVDSSQMRLFEQPEIFQVAA